VALAAIAEVLAALAEAHLTAAVPAAIAEVM
jgi:hypothetical protein